MTSKPLLASLLLLASLPMLSQTTSQPAPPAAPAPAAGAKKPPLIPAGQHQETEGERILKQNCGRCHNHPEGFSPRISGTIARHMRVRASLSAHDEEVLLRFFNP